MGTSNDKNGQRFHNSDDELKNAKKAITLLGGEIEQIEKFNLPGDISRSVIIIKKVKNTDKNYPRLGAKIKKSPL